MRKTLFAIAFAIAFAACGGMPPQQTTVEEQSSKNPDPCYRNCQDERDECNRSCAFSIDGQGYCLCECSNDETICIGGCNGGRHNPLRFCEPPH